MQIDTVFTVVRRHWIAVLVVLAVGVVAAIQLRSEVASDARYEATASLLIVSSPATTTNPGVYVNPLGRLGQSERVAADVVARSMMTPVKRQRLAEGGIRGTYVVTTDPGQVAAPNSPLISVIARAATPDDAALTGRAVIEAVQAELERWQTEVGAPRETWMQAKVLVPADDVRPVTGQGSRVALATLALAAAAAVSVAFLLEGRRAARAAVDLRPAGDCAHRPGSSGNGSRRALVGAWGRHP